MYFNREVDEGVFEMTCTLNMAADLLNNSFGYKYVVYSPKMVKENDCFEFLHSFAGRAPRYCNPNRCLKIDPALWNSMFYYYTRIWNVNNFVIFRG